MQKRHLAIGLLSLFVHCIVTEAKESQADKARAVEQRVIKERLYLKGGCETYLEALTPTQRESYISTATQLMKQEALFFVGNQDTVLGDILPLVKAEGLKETGLVEIKASLKNQPYLVREFDSVSYKPAEIEAATEEFIKVRTEVGKSKKPNRGYDYVVCSAAELGTDIRDLTALAKEYQTFVFARPNQASVGYFDAKVNSCKAVTKVGTGNQFAEPKSWDGSRFYIVDASFKNTDTESRLPVAGSLFIKYNGKDYKFDSVEPVMLEGYNIWFKQINPLVSMKTKLVYRIPDEIEGEVFWGPGRNPEDVRLYCGQVVAKVTK